MNIYIGPMNINLPIFLLLASLVYSGFCLQIEIEATEKPIDI